MSRTISRAVVFIGLTATLVLFFTLPGVSQEETLPAREDAETNQDDPEVLTRGPVHEAFAEQINNNPEAGVLVPKAPPEPIGEVPPEYKPEGENVIWIPGYWSWDDEREDHVWVSGVWRVPPKDRRWVPGYWNKGDNGHHWISGFWISTSRDTIQYQEKPPLSIEQGPTSAAPNENHFWVPGCWQYGTSYRWRPGYWRPFRADWIWIPAHYVWTPRGSIFVNGYWDYRMPRRGQLFAPVYIPYHHRHVHYRYSPSCLINLRTIGMHLFVRPSYHHYYFGDYYGSVYATRNYYSTFHYHRSGFGCDPFLTYYQWHFGRLGINYTTRLRNWHGFFDRHQHHRPARTMRAQTNVMVNQNNQTNLHININSLGRSLQDVARDSRSSQKLVRLATEQRDSHKHNSDRLRQFTVARSEHERTLRTRPENVKRPDGGTTASTRPHPERPHRDLTLPALRGRPERPKPRETATGKITRPAVTATKPATKPTTKPAANAGTRTVVVDPSQGPLSSEELRSRLAEKQTNNRPGAKPATSSRPKPRETATGKITRPAITATKPTTKTPALAGKRTLIVDPSQGPLSNEELRRRLTEKLTNNRPEARPTTSSRPKPRQTATGKITRPAITATKPSSKTPAVAGNRTVIVNPSQGSLSATELRRRLAEKLSSSKTVTRQPSPGRTNSQPGVRNLPNRTSRVLPGSVPIVGPLPSRTTKPAVSNRLPTITRTTKNVPTATPNARPAAVPTRTQQRPTVIRGATSTARTVPSRNSVRRTPALPSRSSLPTTGRTSSTPVRSPSITRPVPSSSLKNNVRRSVPSTSRSTSTRSAPVRRSTSPAPSTRSPVTRSPSRIVGPLPSNSGRSASSRSTQPRTRTAPPRTRPQPSGGRTGSSARSTPRTSPSPRRK